MTKVGSGTGVTENEHTPVIEGLRVKMGTGVIPDKMEPGYSRCVVGLTRKRSMRNWGMEQN